MAGPGGREVGRLSIRVLPDTSRFSTSLQSYLDRVERRAQVKVAVLPDTRRFAREMEADLSRVSARIRVPVTPDTRRFTRQLREELQGTRATIRVPVAPDLSRFERAMRADLRRIRGGVPVNLTLADGAVARLRAELSRVRPPLQVPATVDIDRNVTQRLSRGLRDVAGQASGVLSAAAAVTAVGAAAGVAVPAVVGLVATLAQIAPAAAVGATAIFAVVAANAALKIGMTGVEDALKNAFDPANAEAFNKALKKLTPNAQKFVLALRDMGPEFSKIRKAVQERLFEGLGDQVTRTGKVALPVLRRGLEDAAGALNNMGKGVLRAARELADSGSLGRAVDGATKGLTNLKDVPGEIVKSLTGLAEAASPAFDRVTKAADRAAKRMSDRIAKGLESGSIERAIDKAFEKIKQLGRVGRNIGRTFGNVFGAAEKAGADFLSVLERVTGQLAKVTGTEGAQRAFAAIFETLAVVGETAGRLLGEAFKAIGPALTRLAGPLQTVVRNLERGLTPVIRALGPILEAVTSGLGGVARELSPLLGPLGVLVSKVLSGLAPILKRVAEQAVILAGHVARLLGPALTKLGPLIDPLVRVTGRLVAAFINLQNKVLIKLTPLFDAVGKAFGRVLEALTPLGVELEKFVNETLPKLKPILDPILETIGELVTLFANGLTRVINEFVIPAIEGLVALLQGDFDLAFTKAGVIAANAVRFIGDVLSKLPSIVGKILTRLALVLLGQISKAMRDFEAWVARGVGNAVTALSKLPGKAVSALSDLGWQVSAKARAELGELVDAVANRITQAVTRIEALPRLALNALGDMGSLLYYSGWSLIGGFISGILARVSEVADAASRVVGAARDFFPSSPAKKGPFSGRGWTLYSGQSLIEGMIDGIASRQPALRSEIKSVTAGMAAHLGSVPSMSPSRSLNLAALGGAGSLGDLSVAVFVGDREITDIARAEVTRSNGELLSVLRAGRK